MTRELRSLEPRRSRHVHSVAGSARNPLLPQEDSLHSSSTDLAHCAREIAASLRSALVIARYADSAFGLVSGNRSALRALRMQSPSDPPSRLRTPVSPSESRKLSLVYRSPCPGFELPSLSAPNYGGLFFSGSVLGRYEGSRPLYSMGGIALVSFLSGVVAGYRGGGSDATELAPDDAVSVLTTASRRAKVPAVLMFATPSLLNAVFSISSPSFRLLINTAIFSMIRYNRVSCGSSGSREVRCTLLKMRI